MTNGHGESGADPASDVRAEMERSVGGLYPTSDLLSMAHLRARRTVRRRRAVGGVVVGLTVAAVVGVGALVPTLAAHRDETPAGAARPSATPLTTPYQSVGRTPTRSSPATPPSARTPSRDADVWGATTIGDEFGAAAVDRSLWAVYEGPGDSLGRWSASEVAVRGGELRLSVSRPGGDPPSRWGGVGALGAPQRYGRWEARLRMSVGRGVIGQLVLSPVPGSTADPSPVIVVSVMPYPGTISVSGSGAGPGGTRVATLARPSDFHLVVVEWTPQRVRVLLDGATVSEWTDGRLPGPLWPALQTIMAGPDCGGPALPRDCQGTRTSFPQRLEVDWLRVRAYHG